MLSSTFLLGASAEEKRYLAPLGTIPDWSLLDPYQRTITREEFQRELSQNYAEFIPPPEPVQGETAAGDDETSQVPDPSAEGEEATAAPEPELAEGEPSPPPEPPYWAKFIQIEEERVRIVTNSRRPDDGFYDLYFAEQPVDSVPRYWRSVAQLPPRSQSHQPLEGLRIVIDPGHIGGEFAQMEQRWFKIPRKPPPEAETDSDAPAAEDEESSGDPGVTEKEEPKPDIPVMEGEIVLRVAQLLREKLTRAGARVALARTESKPVTRQRPEDFYDHVREVYGLRKDTDPEKDFILRSRSQRLFYLTSEIRARAHKINTQFRPDLVLCLHVNAEAWGDPKDPDFVDRNHLHILINGCYSEGEMLLDDQRFDMLSRLLQRIHGEEVALADTIAAVMAAETGLPPYTYLRSNARRVSANPFVWSRNLLATRTYQCPVIFFEPYVMNHETTYNRVQAGEYEGTREFEGVQRVNIFEEYASSVADGVLEYYRQHRPYQEPK